jgi:DNA-binding response OmpR family regulator
VNQLLLVEDDASLAMNLKNFLVREGFGVTHAGKLSEIPEELNSFDLVLLDWMLPDGQGLDQIKKIRSKQSQIPVIFLTAKVDLIDKVLGLESGANDYVTKPFEPRELLARIRVQLRRQDLCHQDGTEIKVENICVNLLSRQVSRASIPVEMTRKEFDLVQLLFTNPKKVFTREELLNKVWGFDNFPTTRTVDTHILQLRQKLGEHLFETVRGIGYRFNQ